MEGAALIDIKNVAFRYESAKEWALESVSLSVGKGQIVAIVGPSESGKSTLCMCLNGLIPHEIDGELRGEVSVSNLNTRISEPHEFASIIGMVFQEPESQFVMTNVEDEITFGMENMGIEPEEMEERLDWVINVTRLKGLENKSPRSLSGGQKQRVAIASALALRPQILVLDEPTSELDPVGKHEILTIVEELNHELGMTIVIVEHETEILAQIAHKVVLINKGRVVCEASPREFFSQTDFLRSQGLFVPEVADLATTLRGRGAPFDKIPVIYSEALPIFKERFLVKSKVEA